MIDTCPGPGVCIVAVGALAFIVVWRRVVGVARLTTDKAIVVKGHVRPDIGRVVAVGTLTIVVAWRRIGGVA